MEDLAFKYPKRILQALLVGAMLIAIGWGVITGNSQNAINLWTKEVTFITQPIFNYFTNKMERRMERVMEPALEQLEASGNSASQDQ